MPSAAVTALATHDPSDTEHRGNCWYRPGPGNRPAQHRLILQDRDAAKPEAMREQHAGARTLHLERSHSERFETAFEPWAWPDHLFFTLTPENTLKRWSHRSAPDVTDVKSTRSPASNSSVCLPRLRATRGQLLFLNAVAGLEANPC
jgi:hypothetical protein